MKKWLICALWGLSLALGSSAQEEPRLTERLDSLVRYTSVSDLEKLLDLTYPKVFTLIPREQVLEGLKAGLINDEFDAQIDSVKIIRIFPVFTSGNGQFAKVIHSMRLNMRFNQQIDTSSDDEGDGLMNVLRTKFGNNNVAFNNLTNTISVRMKVNMVAIKDPHSPDWTFINFDDDEEDHELGALLFSEEVLQKLKTYQ